MYSDHLTVWLLPYPASTNRLLGMQNEVYSSRCLDPTEMGHPTERNNRGSAPACSLQISISSIFAQSTCMRSDVTLRFIQAVLHSVVCKKTFLNLNLRFPVLRIFSGFATKRIYEMQTMCTIEVIIYSDIQGTGQKSHRVNTHHGPSQCFVLIKQWDSPGPHQF